MSHALAAAHPLTGTLRALVPTLRVQWRDPWCVIGSAALRLIGVDSTEPQDVDLLCSVEDAERLARHWSAHLDADYTPRDDDRFRSHFARFIHLPLPVEVMGGLRVHSHGHWQSVCAQSVQDIPCHDVRVPVPTADEQLRILELFGRDKDLAKAAQLRPFLASPRHAH